MGELIDVGESAYCGACKQAYILQPIGQSAAPSKAASGVGKASKAVYNLIERATRPSDKVKA